jgi:hypothetical protein
MPRSALALATLCAVEALCSASAVSLLYAVNSAVAVAAGSLVLLSLSCTMVVHVSRASWPSHADPRPRRGGQRRARPTKDASEEGNAADDDDDDDDDARDTVVGTTPSRGNDVGFVVLGVVGVFALGVSLGLSVCLSTADSMGASRQGASRQGAVADASVLTVLAWAAKAGSIALGHAVTFERRPVPLP